MLPPPPQRILFLRPDTYGDLFLFEPVLRLVRHLWPQTEVAVLIREPYADAIPLFAADGVRWLTTTCDPYRATPGESRAALDALRTDVQAYAPDCVVAACAAQTWLEAAVAAWLPQARQVSLGHGMTDPVLRAALDAVVPVDWPAIYPEKIAVAPGLPEWEKNLRLVGALTGRETPCWWPVAQVPAASRADAARVLAEAGLTAGEFVACAAAGTANVAIKSWPAGRYGELLAYLERERGIRALLVGHVSEREHLETVRQAARDGGANPALWVGQAGEMPLAAALLEAARFYFGNDTGALHLAAALGRPVFSIFGGGTWPQFVPVAGRALTVVQPLPCFGCGWECYFADAPCVRTISPASVRRALDQFLQEGSEDQTIFEAEGLDAGTRALIHAATPRLRALSEDHAARGRQVTELTRLLTESEADRDARGKLLETWAAATLPPDEQQHRAVIEDLRQRLQGREQRERDARHAARRFAREAAVARRLLKLSFDPASFAPPPPRPVVVVEPPGRLPHLRGALAAGKVRFHLDAGERRGASLTLSGWAFRAGRDWDAAAATVTILLRRDGATLRTAAATRVRRPELAAYFAAQPRKFSGGARNLEDAGFTGDLAIAELPAGVALEIVLNLEQAGVTCEQPTGKQLWL